MGYTASAIDRIRDAEVSQDGGFDDQNPDDGGEDTPPNEEDNIGVIGGYDFG